MNPALVELTASAKCSAFWKSDPYRNGTGTIVGQYARPGVWRVIFRRPGNWKREFYVSSEHLQPFFPN